jgi:hypothetical protein
VKDRLQGQVLEAAIDMSLKAYMKGGAIISSISWMEYMHAMPNGKAVTAPIARTEYKIIGS